MKRLQVLALVSSAFALAGCGGIELARAEVEPRAVDVGPARDPIGSAAVCTAKDGDAADPLGQMELRAHAAQALAAALGAGGRFRGGTLTEERPEAAEALCEAHVGLTLVSEPEMRTGMSMLIDFFCFFPPYLGIPFAFIWTDREPELAYRYVLEVGVRGEPPIARYEALAHGTICAQSPEIEMSDTSLSLQRRELCDLATRALATQFAGDEAAHARLRAQLDGGPALELEPLLLTKETHAPRARWRTRKVIGWKNEAMAARVSEAKTSELRGLISQLETCMLDLSHEAEIEKDAAQGFTAKGVEAQARAARELSLAYRERVEALRPILTAVKDELDGRGR